jgi:hypothetical protein
VGLPASLSRWVVIGDHHKATSGTAEEDCSGRMGFHEIPMYVVGEMGNNKGRMLLPIQFLGKDTIIN